MLGSRTEADDAVQVATSKDNIVVDAELDAVKQHLAEITARLEAAAEMYDYELLGVDS
jgi:hypothetical protein